MAAASTVLFTKALFREGFIVSLPPIWFSERVELNGYSPQRISHPQAAHLLPWEFVCFGGKIDYFEFPIRRTHKDFFIS